jgi:hypothetical protein
MFADLKRCVRCHQRYPGAPRSRCPLTALSDRREEHFEHAFRTWLESNEGRFAEYLARRQRTGAA